MKIYVTRTDNGLKEILFEDYNEWDDFPRIVSHVVSTHGARILERLEGPSERFRTMSVGGELLKASFDDVHGISIMEVAPDGRMIEAIAASLRDNGGL